MMLPEPVTQDSVCRGIDHVGVTVPDLDAATDFFRALGAEVLYDTLSREDGPNGGADLEQRLGVPPGCRQRAIRMLALLHGPGLELFEFDVPRQREAALPCDLGWQHIAVYVDDVDRAAASVERAGGRALSGPHMLPAQRLGHATAWSTCAHRGAAHWS